MLNVSQFMRRAALGGCLLWLSGLGGSFPAHAATHPPPTFDEVFSLVRSNLVGVNAEELDRLAVDGFLKELGPRVVLIDSAEGSEPAGRGSGEVEAQLYRSSIGYLRVGQVDEACNEQVRQRYQELAASNRLSGLVLDLRSAGGGDYSAALRVADLFLSEEVPLLNWGEGLKRSTAKEKAIALPVAVLVDGQTGGAAEALAAMLRQSGVALLIGGRTAGTAGIQRTFPLAGGPFLRVTVADIQLGDARRLSADGLKPDVEVEVSPRREVASATGRAGLEEDADIVGPTNSHAPRMRMNEADLVRRWRGEMPSGKPAAVEGEEQPAAMRDAVLLRALDLMDGLAILRSWQK